IHQAAGLRTLFDTIVVFESFPVDRAGIIEANTTAGIEITGISPLSDTHYPLAVVATDDPHLQVALQYQHHLFDRDAVENIAARFGRILRQLVADPELPVGRVDLLAPAERDWLLRGLNDTAAPTPEATIPQLFERQAAHTPDAVAVVSDAGSLTYREL